MKPLLINLDLKNNNYEDIELKQGCQDTLIATITDLGEVCDLTGQVISVEMLKADSTFIIQSNDITVTGNKVTIKLNKDFTRVKGKAKLQIKMTKDGIVNGSWVVIAWVRPSAINDNIGQSENIVTIKEELDKSIVQAKVENDKTQDLITNGGAATKGQVADIRASLEDNVQEINRLDITKVDRQVVTEEIAKAQLQAGSVDATNFVVNTDINNMRRNVGNINVTQGKNLFNKDSITMNKLLKTDGTLYDQTGWSVSAFIPVLPLITISIKYLKCICQYDKNKIFIAGTYLSQATEGVYTVALNPKTEFIKIGFMNGREFINQVEYNSTPSDVASPYVTPVLKNQDGTPISVDYVENSPVDFDVKVGGKNKLNKNDILENTVLRSNGLTNVGTGWCTSNFMSVGASKQLTVNQVRYICEYNKHKNFIQGTYIDVNPQALKTFTTNYNTEYIRITVYYQQLSTCQVEEGDVATNYEECYFSVFLNGTKIYDLTGQQGNSTDADLLTLEGYSKYCNRQNYQIYKYNVGAKKVVALRKDIAVRTNGTAIGTRIEISMTGLQGNYGYVAIFNDTNFPNLLPNSEIAHVIIVPYTRNMDLGTIQHGNHWRLNIITTFGQVYHNYPARAIGSDGTEVSGDITRFDESAIWDLPERKYPSLDKNASGVERYMPCLSSDKYAYYPNINQDNGYGNGGFDKSITKNSIIYPRFYQPNHNNPQSNSMTFMGGFEPDNKISVIGTYRANNAVDVRICVFMSDDGGRSWYCKQEFTNLQCINATKIDTTRVAENYVANSYAISKRTLVLPTESDKINATKFSWGSNVVVSNISKGASTVVTTLAAHGLTTRDVIAFRTNNGASVGFEWLLNNTVSPASGGTGVLFGVKVLSDTTFELYEFVQSAYTNIPSRHIHHINRVKDGWLVGTGETYPEGFIHYIQMKDADMFSIRRAYNVFPTARLTSSEGAIQRLLGGHMFDDADSTMMVAIDDERINRDLITFGDGTSLSRSSTGIYKGKLADIDDFDLYRCVFEAKEVAYYFKKKGGAFLYMGQLGECALSFDNGETWFEEHLGKLGEHFMGESNKFVIVDDYIFALKI